MDETLRGVLSLHLINTIPSWETFNIQYPWTLQNHDMHSHVQIQALNTIVPDAIKHILTLFGLDTHLLQIPQNAIDITFRLLQ